MKYDLLSPFSKVLIESFCILFLVVCKSLHFFYFIALYKNNLFVCIILILQSLNFMFCFKCKLIFEKKKKNKGHKATRPISSHFPFLTASHWITPRRELFNEVHVWALLWLLIAHSQHLPALHRIILEA